MQYVMVMKIQIVTTMKIVVACQVEPHQLQMTSWQVAK